MSQFHPLVPPHLHLFSFLRNRSLHMHIHICTEYFGTFSSTFLGVFFCSASIPLYRWALSVDFDILLEFDFSQFLVQHFLLIFNLYFYKKSIIFDYSNK